MQFSINEDGHMLASEPYTPDRFINAMANTSIQVLNLFAAMAPTDDQPQVKEELYDMYNKAVSAVLEALIPDHLHSDQLTAEAILRAENEILDEVIPNGEPAAVIPLDSRR